LAKPTLIRVRDAALSASGGLRSTTSATAHIAKGPAPALATLQPAPSELALPSALHTLRAVAKSASSGGDLSGQEVRQAMEQAGELHKRAAEWLLAQERAGGAPALAQLSVHHHGARQAKEGFAANLAWARHCLRWGLLRCGLEAAQRALLCAAWEESPDHQLGAMALNAILLLALGSASEADTMAQRAASLARDAKNASAEILCLTARALAQRDSDPSKSRELLERARAAARAHHLEPLLEGFS